MLFNSNVGPCCIQKKKKQSWLINEKFWCCMKVGKIVQQEEEDEIDENGVTIYIYIYNP